MSAHDLNWEFSSCDPFGFGRPGVTHERGEDAVCARFVIVRYLALRVGPIALAGARRPLQKGEKLEEKIAEQLSDIRNDPELVRSFFGAPSVAHISDC